MKVKKNEENKTIKKSIKVIKRGQKLENSAAIYSCCRKTQRLVELH